MRPTSASSAGTSVPAFLSKLWKMVNDPETNHLICWSPGGHSFVIQNEAQFWYSLLPIYYKHNNMSSFIRQLNMYGFHKVSSENGGMDCDKDEIKFFHPHFQQGQPNLLKHIKRKIPSSKTSTTTAAEETTVNNVDQISKVLVDVKQLRGRQENVDSQLVAMKQENAALWRELALLRQKHMKQQQIVNKLIHFLVTIVQPSRTGLGGLGVKRRYPLMINDAKYPKLSKTESNFDGPTIHELDPETALNDSILLHDIAGSNKSKMDNQQMRVESPSAESLDSNNVLLDIPIEETDNLPDDSLSPDMLLESDPNLEDAELIIPDKDVGNLLADTTLPLDTNNDTFSQESDLSQVISDKDILQVAEQIYNHKEANIEEPSLEDAKFQVMNPNAMISNVSMGSGADNAKNYQDKRKSMTVSTKNAQDLTNFKINAGDNFCIDELDNHLETTQGELDSIKDMLFEGYPMDANAILGNLSNPYDAVPLQLFNPNEDFPLDVPPLTNPEENKKSTTENGDPMMSGSELTTYVNTPFGINFDNLFEDSSDALINNDITTEASQENIDDQLTTPVIIKKEPTYPVVKRTNKK